MKHAALCVAWASTLPTGTLPASTLARRRLTLTRVEVANQIGRAVPITTTALDATHRRGATRPLAAVHGQDSARTTSAILRIDLTTSAGA